MFKPRLIALAAAAALLAAPAHRADANDFAAGVVTGVIGSIIVNQANTRPPRNRTVVVNRESPQRAANRITQSALNYFGFNAGTADGVFGPKTATAVRAYQAYMGFPEVGRLTTPEHDILVNAYNRGQLGDAETLRLVSSTPEGARVLLKAARDAMFGYAASAGGAPASAPPAVASGSESVAAGTPPPAVAPPATVPTILPLIPVPSGKTDLASLCGANSGPRITLASMNDPADALKQAFCDSVASATETSTSLANSVPGVTLAQIEAQCTQLGPVVAGYVGSLAAKPREAVLADVQAFVDETGADPVQLASTARICLGTGYRMANMDVAVGSALLLTAMGEPAYGELMGQHLHHGVGVAQNSDRGLEWLVWSTEQIANGATPVFDDGLHGDLVGQAVFRLNGGVPDSIPAAAAKSTGSKGKSPMRLSE